MARRRLDLFARLSLDYADHPKIAGLSDAAFRTHVEMILYSRRYLTDGRIAKQIAKRWPERALSELLANDDDHPSLALTESGDYLIHGFAEMQETRAEVEAKRQVRAEAGRLGGLARSKPNAKHKPSNLLSKNVAETETETETSSQTADAADEKNARDDVNRLCTHLADRIANNGIKRPNITKGWRDAARLMLDRDGYTETDIARVIDWATSDEFWRANILSMPKLREKYPQLVLKAGGGRPATTTARDAEDLWTRLREQSA